MPVTSYMKMLDIWMIFTMIVPFIEVAMHACNQYLKKRRRVVPTMISTKIGSETQKSGFSFATLSRLLLPLVSLLFSAGFWILGFLLSLWYDYFALSLLTILNSCYPSPSCLHHIDPWISDFNLLGLLRHLLVIRITTMSILFTIKIPDHPHSSFTLSGRQPRWTLEDTAALLLTSYNSDNII